MKFIIAFVVFALAITTAYSAVVPFPYSYSGTYTAPAGFDYAAPYYYGSGYYNGAYYAGPAGYFRAF